MNLFLSTHKSNRTKGMTLLEMLVVIAIILIIIPVLYQTILTLYSTHKRIISRAFALAVATQATQHIVRDVRGAVYGEDGSLPMVAIATSSVTLFTDTDFDGMVERVRYTLTGTDLQKGIIEPTASSTYPVGSETVSTIARDIMNNAAQVPLFRYYSATSTEITQASAILNVRRVDIAVVGASSDIGNQQYKVQVSSSASIRNLKDAY